MNPILDRILYAILNQVNKAFQLKLTYSLKAVTGDVGEYTTVDEAMSLAQASSPASVRVSLYADIYESAAISPPVLANGEVVYWHDTTNDKYYHCVGVGAGMKSVELT